MADFLWTRLKGTEAPVFRLGLSGSYFPGEHTLRAGVDAGMNYLFWYYWDRQMTSVLRDILPANREKYVIATGVGNMGARVTRMAINSCLRKVRTDYIDVFHVFWVSSGMLGPRTFDVLQQAKEEGKIRRIAVSTHARPYAAELIRNAKLDLIMMRYNAAHRGAEQDIFPYLPASNPAVVSYTATRWGKLLKRPRQWPAGSRVPTAGECYRFALSNPAVNLCLTAPRNERELRDNLESVARGPLCPEDARFMQDFGDAVRRAGKFFWS